MPHRIIGMAPSHSYFHTIHNKLSKTNRTDVVDGKSRWVQNWCKARELLAEVLFSALQFSNSLQGPACRKIITTGQSASIQSETQAMSQHMLRYAGRTWRCRVLRQLLEIWAWNISWDPELLLSSGSSQSFCATMSFIEWRGAWQSTWMSCVFFLQTAVTGNSELGRCGCSSVGYNTFQPRSHLHFCNSEQSCSRLQKITFRMFCHHLMVMVIAS